MSSVSRKFIVSDVSVVADQPRNWDGGTVFILSHGAGQGMHSPFMSFFHAGIANAGHLAIKFNFSYMEKGRRTPDSQNKLEETYRGVIDWAERKWSPKVMVIGGKSMGGRVASQIARTMETVRGLLFLGYPLHPPGHPERLKDAHLYEIEKPMLFISGTRDTFARREPLDAVVRNIGSQAVLHWVDGGDHSLRVRQKELDPTADTLDAIRDWSERLH